MAVWPGDIFKQIFAAMDKRRDEQAMNDLVYPSKAAHIRALLAKGKGAKEIAKLVGVSRGYVEAVAWSEQQKEKIVR